MSVAWPENTIEAKNTLPYAVFDGGMLSAEISDMNVHATLKAFCGCHRIP